MNEPIPLDPYIERALMFAEPMREHIHVPADDEDHIHQPAWNEPSRNAGKPDALQQEAS